MSTALARRLGLLAIGFVLLASLSVAPTLAQDDPIDTDGDWAADAEDICIDAFNPAQLDADGDGIGDACDDLNDDDVDEDLIPNDRDNCSALANTGQIDWDGDGIGDACDPTPQGEDTDTSTDASIDTDTSPVTRPDSDDDGDPDAADNCPLDPNPDQDNTDGDQLGDACDPSPDGDLVPGDSDGDFVPDEVDNCLDVANTTQLDTDHDGKGDACDLPNEPEAPERPLVTISMTGSERSIAPSQVSFEITVTSATNSVNPIILSSELPRGDALDWSTSTPGCQILDVQGQERLMCPSVVLMGNGETFTAEVSSATEEAICGDTLTANAIADPGLGDPVTSDPVSTEVLCPTELALSITPDSQDAAEVEPGQHVSYKITVANGDEDDAVNLNLTLPLPEGVTGWQPTGATFDSCGVSEGQLTCTDDLLPHGQSRTVTITGTLPAAIASCDVDLSTTATAEAANAVSVSDDGDYIIICEPDVHITMKTIPADSTVVAGEDVGYTITLTNTGFAEAPDVGFTDDLPRFGGTWAITQPAGVSCEIVNDKLDCAGIDLAPVTGTFSITVKSPTVSSLDLCGDEKLNGAHLKAPYDGSRNMLVTVSCSAEAWTTFCEQQASEIFIDPSEFTIVTGTNAADVFSPTTDPELFCGFGGTDTIETLASNDVFLGGNNGDSVSNNEGQFEGGDGADEVTTMNDGLFLGGSDNDAVDELTGGSFGGEAGNDNVNHLNNAGFFGGAGADTVTTMTSGYFHGGSGSGSDSVDTMAGGFFDGRAGDDSITTMTGGDFYGRSGNDTVTNLGDPATMIGTGSFNGGVLAPNSDTIVNLYAGTHENVENVPAP